jgi:Fic family protein
LDPTQFTTSRAGELVNILIAPGVRDCAFIPALLPPTFELSKELTNLCVDAWSELGELGGISATLSSPELLQRPLEDREALQSSKLEGTIARPEDLLLYVHTNEERSADEESDVNAHREVHNYREALRYGQQSLASRGISLGLIRDMHEMLMSGVRGQGDAAGRQRTRQVAIGTNFRYVPPPAVHVSSLMENLETYIDAERITRVDRLTACYIAHYQFEAIHPFEDGNGRIGRVVLALMIAHAARHTGAWLYLSPFFEQNKQEYIDRMFRVSSHGDWLGWIEFCLRGTIAQARDAVVRCRMLQTLYRRYKHSVTQRRSSRLERIVESLFITPVVTVTSLARAQDVTFKTAQSDIAVLTTLGILKRMEGHRIAVHYAPAIFQVAYAQVPMLSDDERSGDEEHNGGNDGYA